MSINTLLEELTSYLLSDHREQLEKYDAIKNTLRKLKNKENNLKDKLKSSQDKDETEKLQKEFDILFVQRKKGIKLKKELKILRDKNTT
jgi:predicted  nucleic acid-binding Zn-ribbon protein